MKLTVYIICISILLSYPTLGIAVINDHEIIFSTDTTAINTQSATVLLRGTWSFSVRNGYYQYRPFSNVQLLQFSEKAGQPVECNDYLNLMTFSVAYGLTDSFTIGTTLPFLRLANIRTGEISEEMSKTNISKLGNSQGFGDTGLYGQWLMFDNKLHHLSAMLIFGSNIPTGAAHVRDRNGELFFPTDQPGRGTWAPFIGAAFTKDSLSANLLYTKGLIGAQNANVGDVYNYNLAFVHKTYQSSSNLTLNTVLEFNGEYSTKPIISGVRDQDSGANIIYFTPGFKMNMQHGITPYIAVSLPLIQTVNGFQPKVHYQLTCGVDITT